MSAFDSSSPPDNFMNEPARWVTESRHFRLAPPSCKTHQVGRPLRKTLPTLTASAHSMDLKRGHCSSVNNALIRHISLLASIYTTAAACTSFHVGLSRELGDRAQAQLRQSRQIACGDAHTQRLPLELAGRFCGFLHAQMGHLSPKLP